MSNEMTDTLQIGQRKLNLDFKGISYVANRKRGQKSREILHGVSGRFRSGKLTAVLGPSGAGKTSLMNILSGFRTQGVTGSVRVNGIERVPQAFRKESSYITQDFAMLPLLTVYETFKSTADLKLGRTISDAKKDFVIAEIAKTLNILTCFHTQVRYLSGGEMKRLSIGLELITNPPIMFFDEPTSGLDSSSSVQVISHLKTLAQGGRTIVCVIHQPSSRLFEMFDDVFIIVDGRTLFNGAVDEIVPVFEAAGFICPNYYNRADFAIEVACKEKGGELEALFTLSDARFAEMCQQDVAINGGSLSDAMAIRGVSGGGVAPCQFELLEPMLPGSLNNVTKSTKIQISPLRKPLPSSRISKLCCSSVPYPTSVWLQFWILLKRSFLCTCIRDLHMAQIRFVAQIVVGILMGMVFYDFGDNGSKVQSNMSYLFFSLMFIFFSNAMPTVQTFPSEAAVFFREHLNSWYSTRAYYFSKLVSDLPMQIICPVTYLSITYFMTNQPMETDRFCKVLLLGVFLTIMAQALGHTFGAAFDAQLGTFLIPASAIPMFLFSGFFILLSELPNYLHWMSYISYFRYPYEGLMIAVYGGNRQRLECTDTSGYCKWRYPKKVLEEMNLNPENFWLDIAGIAAWIVFLRITFFAVLKWKLYRKRGY